MTEPRKWPTSDELVRDWPRGHSDPVMLSFSGGKDSVAAWLHMRPHFTRIVPVYYYLVPDLGFIEKGLRYFEQWFGTPILRLPHPALHRMLNAGVYQTWHSANLLAAAGLPDLDYDALRVAVAAMNVKVEPESFWCAVGSRAADSTIRGVSFRKYGPVRSKQMSFYPVWDWNKQRVIDTIRAAGVKLPMEYRLFGRTPDGLGHRFLHGIRQHWPDDYERIREWFPHVEAELKRYEFLERRLARGEA